MKFLYGLLLLTYGFFCWLMVGITGQYIPIRLDAAFLLIKQDYTGLWHYRVAFFIHVFTAIGALAAGFTQFSPSILRQYPRIHRFAGWVYVLDVLLFAAPSGLVIGYYANGGWTSQTGFCLLAVLWIFFTAIAVQRIRKRDIRAHRDWMIRSFALTLSAITLRAWKYILVAAFAPHPMDAYRIVAWLGWVLNLAVAEWIIYRRHKNRI